MTQGHCAERVQRKSLRSHISELDVEALAQTFVDSGTVNEAEGWVSGFDASVLEAAQNDTQAALEQYITEHLPAPTVGDVIGGRRTIIQAYPALPSGLPNAIVVTGVRYGAMPAALQQQMTFSLGTSGTGAIHQR